MSWFGVDWSKVRQTIHTDLATVHSALHAVQPEDFHDPHELIPLYEKQLEIIKDRKLHPVARLPAAVVENKDAFVQDILEKIDQVIRGDMSVEKILSSDIRMAQKVVSKERARVEMKIRLMKELAEQNAKWITVRKTVLRELSLAHTKFESVKPDRHDREQVKTYHTAQFEWLTNPSYHSVSKMFWVPHPQRREWIDAYLHFLNAVIFDQQDAERELHAIEAKIDAAVQEEIEKLARHGYGTKEVPLPQPITMGYM